MWKPTSLADMDAAAPKKFYRSRSRAKVAKLALK
jgi:hypothetical protein